MYQIAITTTFERDTKRYKHDKQIKQLYLNAINAIENNPGLGTQLTANIFPYFKYETGERPQFRLIYMLYECSDYCIKNNNCKYEDLKLENDCKGLIEFHFFKTREECNNFYNRDREYFQERLRK